MEGTPALNRLRWAQTGREIAVGDSDGQVLIYDVGEVRTLKRLYCKNWLCFCTLVVFRLQGVEEALRSRYDYYLVRFLHLAVKKKTTFLIITCCLYPRHVIDPWLQLTYSTKEMQATSQTVNYHSEYYSTL